MFKATQQQRQASDPVQNVWVTANAGSGKTHVLVERVARLLLTGAEPSAILCITYTKAAAAEMSTRLFTRLGKWATSTDADLEAELKELTGRDADPETLCKARRLFAKALETPGGLKIQTIHAFCEKLLQQFPTEAGMAPGFQVMTDRDSQNLVATAIDDTLMSLKTNSALADCLVALMPFISSSSFENLIKQFLGNARGFRNILNSELDQDQFSLLLKNSLELSLDYTQQSLAKEICAIDKSAYSRHANILASIKIHRAHDVAALLRKIATTPLEIDHFRNLFLKADLDPRADLVSVATKKQFPETDHFLEIEKQRIVALLYTLDLLVRVDATSNLFNIARAVFQKIEMRKKQLGQYDFDDLIIRTSRLLNGSRAAQWVLYKLDASLKHILVDEAQDTSPSQWDIVSALIEEFFAGVANQNNKDRTLFVVGDRKQSIYSFQGADIHALAKAKSSMLGRIVGADKALSQVDLSISYRSTKEVLAAVDKVFPPQKIAQFGFEASDTVENSHQSNRLEKVGRFELWPIVESSESKTEDKPWHAPVDREPAQSPRRLLASKIADTIKSWIGRRQLEARGRLVQADDILILFQSRNPLFAMLISELRKRNVPVSGADRLHLRQSLIVNDLLMLIQWLSLPQDDFALACVLKSPLLDYVITEDDLMRLSIARGSSSLWQRLQDTQNVNLPCLLDLQQKFIVLTPYEFTATLLTKVRRNIALRLGTEAIDASNAFLDATMTYQMEFGNSLVGFMHWFQSSDTSIKREMEQAAGEVRLMTVHGAKGLEANIVFLADAATTPTGGQSDPILLTGIADQKNRVPLWTFGNLTEAPILRAWKDHAKQLVQNERNRLLYVAMTRACDELYVCGHKSDRNISPDCWYTMVAAALGEASTSDQGFESTKTLKTQTPEKEKVELPDWAMQQAAPEIDKSTDRPTNLQVATNFTISSESTKAQKRGTAIHTLLHELASKDKAHWDSYARIWSKRQRIPETEAMNLVAALRSSELEPFFGSESYSEAELSGFHPDGRALTARVDQISIGAEYIHLLDYKTDRIVPMSLAKSHPYVEQMALYAVLLQEAFPGRKIKAALLWTQTSKLMWLNEELLLET